MKIFRFALNIWITVASVLSFLIGWVALAHSPKPVQYSQPQVTISSAAPLPTLTPLQLGGNSDFQSFQAPSTGFNSNNNSNSGFFNSAPQPIFRTGGS